MMMSQRRGRPTSERPTDLGEYLEQCRGEKGWTIYKLAAEAKVSNRTLSKLELGAYLPKKPEMLLRLAQALEVHPDQLLLRAALTPYLRPPTTDGRQERKFFVTIEEYRELDNYLQILRFTKRR